jgi:16S rRNA (uracil1498-N3)-methyltransferase
LPQFFVPRKNIHPPFFELDESESYHLIRVLRKKEGDPIRIFDGEGSIYFAQITDCSDPKKLKGRIQHKWSQAVQKGMTPPNPMGFETQDLRPPAPAISVHLYPALLKGPRFEWMLEKVTELGVASIHPIWTERTLITIHHKIQSKVNRWEKLILSAAKQCGAETLPKIFDPVSFKEAIQSSRVPQSSPTASTPSPQASPYQEKTNPTEKREYAFILWEREEKKIFSEILRPLKSKQQPIHIHLFFGPEGGLTLKEIEMAKASGIESMSLGQNILRAETAVIAATSLTLL